MRLLIFAISWFAQILIYLLLARAICSWFARPGGSMYKVYQFLSMLTEPLVAPCRMITSRFNTGMLDLSVFLAVILVMVLRSILINVILMFA